MRHIIEGAGSELAVNVHEHRMHTAGVELAHRFLHSTLLQQLLLH